MLPLSMPLFPALPLPPDSRIGPLCSITANEFQQNDISLANLRVYVRPLPLEFIPALPAVVPGFKLAVIAGVPVFGVDCLIAT